ncbi:MAG TPA: hypothetical protein DCX03_11635 [Bacteroidales bacterium]|nr:hypothetical protein [Bacteroidales bacterium]
MVYYFHGIALGITLAFLIGPALFVLLQTSLHRGMKAGLFIALGIFLSDASVLGLCLAGFSRIFTQELNQNIYFKILGGMVLIVFGVWTLTRRAEVVPETNEEGPPIKLKVPGPMVYILKGFILNISNPGLWFLWITAVVSANSAYGAGSPAIYYFFAGTLTTTLATDSLKCFIADKISNKLNSNIIIWTNRVIGLLLIGFGLVLGLSSIVNFGHIFSTYGGLKVFKS